MLAVSASSAFPAPDHSSPHASPRPAAAPVRPDGGSGRWRDLRTPAQPWRHRPVSAFCPGNNRRVADLLQAVERPVEADKDLPAPGLDSPGGGQHILAVQRGKNRLRRETQSGETVMRKRDKCAPPVRRGYSLFHPGYMQQLLAQGFSVTHQLPRRLSRAFRAKRAKVTSANSSFIIGPETPADRFFASSPSFCAPDKTAPAPRKAGSDPAATG